MSSVKQSSGWTDFFIDFGIGAFTGGATKTVIAPIERVKLIM